MPVLSNPRHERFAQELAKGTYATDAHEMAGFKRHDGNASTLSRRPDIAARVEELSGRIAARVVEETGIDRSRILMELATIALAPVGHADVKSSDKRAALVDYARIEGWVIERTETGKPGDFDRMADNELEEFISRRENRTGESPGRAREANSQAGVRSKSNGVH